MENYKTLNFLFLFTLVFFLLLIASGFESGFYNGGLPENCYNNKNFVECNNGAEIQLYQTTSCIERGYLACKKFELLPISVKEAIK